MSCKTNESLAFSCLQEGFAHAMVLNAFKDRTRLNISEVARAVGISPQRMHGYWNQDHAWPAEVWVKTMMASGKWRMEEVL